jgi:DNA replication protein DnaC
MIEIEKTLSNLRVLQDKRRADDEQQRAALGCASCEFGSSKAEACSFFEPQPRAYWRHRVNDLCKHGPRLVQLRQREDELEERRRRLRAAGLAPDEERLRLVVEDRLSETTALRAVRVALKSPAIRWLTLSGGNGCGKTLAAISALAGRGGIYLPAGRLARLPAYGDDGRLTVDDAMSARLLVVDDLAIETTNAHGAAQVEEVIAAREYGAQLTIITTNATAAQLWDRYGSRLQSRLGGERGLFQACRDSDRRSGPKLLGARKTGE